MQEQYKIKEITSEFQLLAEKCLCMPWWFSIAVLLSNLEENTLALVPQDHSEINHASIKQK